MNSDTKVLIGKGISAAALAYVLYIAVTCPCKPELYKCHLTQIYIALSIFLAVVIYFNGFRFTNYT